MLRRRHGDIRWKAHKFAENGMRRKSLLASTATSKDFVRWKGCGVVEERAKAGYFGVSGGSVGVVRRRFRRSLGGRDSPTIVGACTDCYTRMLIGGS